MHNNRQNAPVLSVSPAAAAVWLWSASSEGYPKVRNHGEGPYKGLLLRHYAKQALIPRSLNVKLGPRRKSHKGWAGWLA